MARPPFDLADQDSWPDGVRDALACQLEMLQAFEAERRVIDWRMREDVNQIGSSPPRRHKFSAQLCSAGLHGFPVTTIKAIDAYALWRALLDS